MTQYEAMEHADPQNPDDAIDLTGLVYVGTTQDTTFSLAGAPSGQNLFLMFTQANPTIVDGRIPDVSIIATGKDPANQSGANPSSTADDIRINTGDTINTSQAGGPTTFGTNNQMITEQEGIRFTFVTGARADVTIPNLDQNEADLESNIDFTGVFGARTAAFDVVQLQSGKSAQVKISAFNTAVESGTSFIDGYAGDAATAMVSVRVRVLNAANVVLESFSNGAEGGLSSAIGISINGGVAMITGVLAGFKIEYTTAADHNRVLVENGAALNASGNTHADFHIGGFRLLQASPAAAEIGSKIVFEDDGPSIDVADTAPPDALTVDETDLSTDASANFADNFSSTPSYGADGAGQVSSAYALSVKSPGVDSGLVDTLSGESVVLSVNGSGVVEGRTSGSNALVFTVSVDATGTVTLDQQRAVVHADAGNPDDSTTLSAADLIALTRTDTITDGDGDQNTDAATLNIGQALNFEDDGPSIIARSDLIYSNSSNPSPGGTGTLDYEIGADARLSFSASNSDFSAITLTGTVGSSAITGATVTWSSESTTDAFFGVSFSYQPDPGSAATTNATGTLSFDKVNGTYSLALNAPIAGFNTVSTGQALGFTGYTLGTQTVDHTQADVSVAQLTSDFFVQFTGYSEPGGGTGANNIQAIDPSAPLGAANGSAFVNGELFRQDSTWVSVSNLANGVAGDTIQKGEVLDLDFFTANPFGIATATPTAQAAAMYLKFDGINNEDLVLVLKLVDPDDNSRTTKAIIIDNADITKFGGTIPAPYSISLDNNDGAVIIESNDFNTGSENYVIEGAQLLVSTEDVTGTAINLNALTGVNGGSTTFQEFSGTPGDANPEASTTDNDVIKISDIGFVTVNSGQLDANLQFSLAVQDADGDATATQVLDVGIVGGTTFSGGADDEAIQGSAGNDTLNGGAGNDTLTGGLGKDTLTGGDGNDVYDFNAVAESAAGANKDVINGFASGVDKIDLSGIDAISGNVNPNDAFSYLGNGAFTSVAGQLRFDVASSTLQGDVDGNGVADFEVQLVGVVTPPLLSDMVV